MASMAKAEADKWDLTANDLSTLYEGINKFCSDQSEKGHGKNNNKGDKDKTTPNLNESNPLNAIFQEINNLKTEPQNNQQAQQQQQQQQPTVISQSQSVPTENSTTLPQLNLEE